MHEMERHEKRQLSFREGLALPDKFDVRSAESSSIARWDSIAHLRLVAGIEDAFGISLSAGDVIDLQGYGAAIAILKRHGVWGDV